MKKSIFTAAVLLCSLGAFAQGKKLSQEVSKAPEKLQTEVKADNTKFMKFNKETHDFGNIKKGDPAAFEFSFKNTGKEPITIQSARGSCGCTVPTYSKEPVAPGKSGSIKVTYDSNRIGAINKNVTVVTNLGTKVLYIKGNVENTPESSVPGNTSMIRTK